MNENRLKIIVFALKAAIALIGIDLFVVLASVSHRIPLTSLVSQNPVTNVFLILLLALGVLVLERARRRQPWTRGQQALVFFLSVWVVYLSNFRWRGSGDVVAASLLPFTILRDGSIYLDRFSAAFLSETRITWVYTFNGHTLSIFSSANAVVLIPFYAISALFNAQPTDLFVHQLQKIGASCYVAASAVLLWDIFRRSLHPKWALLLGLAYAFGTSSWSTSSQAIWQHGPSQFFISLGLFALMADGETLSPRAALLAGFAWAMAVWCRYTDILFYAPVLLYVAVRQPRKLVHFCLGSLLPVLALLGDNVMHSEALFKTGQHMVGEGGRFTNPVWEGFIGLLVSPARGLFLFSPFFLWAFAELLREIRRPGWPMARYLGIGVFAHLIFYARWYDWGGGWCFGPRMLADLTPLLILFVPPLVPAIERQARLKSLFLFSILYAILLHGMGAYLTWWWEIAPPPTLWAPIRYPVVYLLTHLTTPKPSDQFFSAWAMIILGIAAAVSACRRANSV